MLGEGEFEYLRSKLGAWQDALMNMELSFEDDNMSMEDRGEYIRFAEKYVRVMNFPNARTKFVMKLTNIPDDQRKITVSLYNKAYKARKEGKIRRALMLECAALYSDERENDLNTIISAGLNPYSAENSGKTLRQDFVDAVEWRKECEDVITGRIKKGEIDETNAQKTCAAVKRLANGNRIGILNKKGFGKENTSKSAKQVEKELSDLRDSGERVKASRNAPQSL